MSLINQVLRDLQSRQVSPPGAGLQSQIRAVKPENSRTPSISLVLSAILLAALCLSVFYILGDEAFQIEAVLSEPLVVHSTAAVVNDNEIASANLAALQLVGTGASSRLQLEFSRPLKLKPEIIVADRQMTVILPEWITPAPQLPLLGVKNALVSSLHLAMIDQCWQLQVFFSRAVRIEKLTIEADALHGERMAFDISPLTDKAETGGRSAAVLAPAKVEGKKNNAPKAVHRVAKTVRRMSPIEQAEDLFQRGVKAAQEHQQQNSMTYWQQTLRVQPEHIQARKQLILALIATNRSLADELFAKGLTLHDPLDLSKWYARALLPVSGAAEAAAILKGQIVSVAQDEEYIALQAGLWQQTGDYLRARQAYVDLLQEFPAKGLYAFGLAIAHDQLAEQEKAIESYQRAALNSDLSAELKSYSRTRIDALAQTRGAGH